MKPPRNTPKFSDQGGFILATVLVFLVVLSLTAFLAARLTRTDVQVVNNLQNEREAFTIAESGVHEALYRLSLAMGDTATVSGVSGGAFNASLSPVVPGRTAPALVTPYGLDYTNTTKTAQIILSTSGPATGTNRNVVPSLQPASTRLLYSTTAADSDAGAVSLDSTANLTVGWDICANNTDPGCSAGANQIRQLPLSHPRYVVKIVSTGQSGNAKRRIVAKAVDCIPNSGPGSVVSLGQDCASALSMVGSTSITAAGSISINAGATSNPPSSCQAVSTGGAHSFVTAGYIDVAGSVGNSNLTPTANTGANPTADPLSNILPPCFTGYSPAGGCTTLSPAPTVQQPAGCSYPGGTNGSAANPGKCTLSGTVTLQPGIYYGGLSLSGNVTLASGVYIMAGGGMTLVTGNSSITNTAAGGIMIYNTQDPVVTTGAGAYGAFSLGNGNATASLVAPTSGDYAGLAYFQDRNNTTPIDLQGGNSGNYSLDGAIYAPNAPASLQGHTNGTISASFIVKSLTLNGGSNITVGNPSTPILTCDTSRYTLVGWQDF